MPKTQAILKTQHQDLITHIKRCNRDSIVPRPTAQLKTDLLNLITSLREDINQTSPNPKGTLDAPTFSPPSDWDFYDLFKNTSDLLAYRECLGLAHLNEEAYADDYATFLNNNKFFIKQLEQKNPFVMHEHLIHIFNILIHCQNMVKGAMAPKEQLLNKTRLYQEILLLLTKQIKSLDHNDVGTFKDYLNAFAQYALALSYGEPEFKDLFNPDLCVTMMKEAHIATRIAREYERVSTAISSNDSDKLIDFYTCGQGLFARTAIQSFEQLEKHIASLGILQSRELTYNFDVARKHFDKEYIKNHGFLTEHPQSPAQYANKKALLTSSSTSTTNLLPSPPRPKSEQAEKALPTGHKSFKQ